MPHSYAHADSDADSDAHAYANAYADSHADADSHSYANADADSNARSVRHSRRQQCGSSGLCDLHAEVNANGRSDPDAGQDLRPRCDHPSERRGWSNADHLGLHYSSADQRRC
jgi:hypothetical protein